MAQLRRDYEMFKSRDTEIIAIGPDSHADFIDYWADHSIPFIGLADPDHTVARLYEQEVNLFKFGRIPAEMVLDKQGIVRYVHYAQSMADIPDNKEILSKLEVLNNHSEA